MEADQDRGVWLETIGETEEISEWSERARHEKEESTDSQGCAGRQELVSSG